MLTTVGFGEEIGGKRCFWVWYGRSVFDPGPTDCLRFFLFNWNLDG